MKRKSIVIFLLSIALLAIPAGVSLAQDGPPPPDGRQGRFAQRDGMLPQLLGALTEAAGLDAREILPELREGATLAELIEANGGDVAAVQAEATALISERVNEAVADGRVPQERADAFLGQLDERLNNLLNGNVDFGNLRDRSPNRADRRGPNANAPRLMQAGRLVIDATDLTPQDLRSALESGQSLADVLTTNGVDVDAFVEEQVNRYAETLTQAVENGRMSQAVADARLELRRVELIDALNRTIEVEAPDAG